MGYDELGNYSDSGDWFITQFDHSKGRGRRKQEDKEFLEEKI